MAGTAKTVLQLVKGKPDPDATISVNWPWDEKRKRRARRLKTAVRLIGAPIAVGASAAGKYRAALAPWTVLAVVATGVTLAEHTSHPRIVGLVMALLVALAAIGAADSAKGKRATQIAGWAVAAAAAWTALASVAGTGPRPVRVAGIVVFLAGALPWWQHHGFGLPSAPGATTAAELALIWKVRMGKVFPDVSIVPGSVRPIIVAGKVIGEEAIIEAGDDTDITTRQMIEKTEAATGRAKLPLGQFVIDATEDGRLHQARIAMFHSNPLRATQWWPGGDFTVESGTSTIGIRIDGQLVDYVWAIPRFGAWHDMFAGTTGAGKSSLIGTLLATSRAAGGAIVDWVIDPQAGQSCPDWVHAVDRFAGSAEEGLLLLKAAERVMYARNKLLAAWKWCDKKGREHTGYEYFPWMTIGMPLLVITIFEAHAVLALDGARAVAEAIGKMARKCGIKLRLEVQVPVLSQLGNSTVLEGMVKSGNVVVFRTGERLTGPRAFNGALPVDPSSIPKAFPGPEPLADRVTAGLGYVLGGSASAMQFRAWRVEDALDAATEGQTWHLEDAVQDAAGQWPPTAEDVIAAATVLTVQAAEEPETEQSAGTTREQILALLDEGPQLFLDLKKSTGRARSTVYEAVNKLKDEGLIEETATGTYARKELVQ